MEKVKAEKAIESHSEEFTVGSEKWKLDTQWGDIAVMRPGSDVAYILDPKKSSLVNLSLIVIALRGLRPEVAYSFKCDQEGKKCLMEVNTPVERLTYNFDENLIEGLSVIKREATLINIAVADFVKYLPISGSVSPKLWQEYGPRDRLVVLDYSNLKLTKLPLIFTGVIGREGYTSIIDKTPKGCKVFIHWNKCEPLEKDSSDWRLNYFLFPREYIDSETELEYRIDTYPKVRQAVKDGRQLLVYEDQVIDIAKFFARHPGNADTLTLGIGREIGRWIYGNFEQAGRKHDHSAKGRHLIGKYQIDTITDTLKQNLYSGVKFGKFIGDSYFILDSNTPINEKYFMLALRNPEVTINPTLSKVKDYGKYFAITSVAKEVTRNFACCHALNKGVMDAHLRLAEAVGKDLDFTPLSEDASSISYETISLAVKPTGAYSQWLASTESLRTKFVVKGPFGPGLELDPNHNKPVAAIVGGCGITMLLDLICYLFRLNASKIGATKKRKYSVFRQEEFKELTNPDFKLLLFVSCRSQKELPYYQLLSILEAWRTSHKFNNVQVFFRFSDVNPEKWNGAFFKDKLPASLSRVYLCGGLPFTKSISKTLYCAGYDTDLIAPL